MRSSNLSYMGFDFSARSRCTLEPGHPSILVATAVTATVVGATHSVGNGSSVTGRRVVVMTVGAVNTDVSEVPAGTMGPAVG